MVNSKVRRETFPFRSFYLQIEQIRRCFVGIDAAFQRQMSQIHADRCTTSARQETSLSLRSRRRHFVSLLSENAVLREKKIRRFDVDVDVQHFDFLQIVFHQQERTMFHVGVRRIRHLFHSATRASLLHL